MERGVGAVNSYKSSVQGQMTMYTETYLPKVETYRSAGGHNGKMEIGEEYRGDITIVEIKGRIDIDAASSLGERLTALIKAGRNRVLVDLKDLLYINSAGLRALLIAGRLAAESKGALILCSVARRLPAVCPCRGL